MLAYSGAWSKCLYLCQIHGQTPTPCPGTTASQINFMLSGFHAPESAQFRAEEVSDNCTHGKNHNSTHTNPDEMTLGALHSAWNHGLASWIVWHCRERVERLLWWAIFSRPILILESFPGANSEFEFLRGAHVCDLLRDYREHSDSKVCIRPCMGLGKRRTRFH